MLKKLYHEWWLLKEMFASHVYRPILLSKSSFKRLHVNFTLLKQLNTNQLGISIPTHQCLQWCLQLLTFKRIFSPRAIKYHKILSARMGNSRLLPKCSHGKWQTASLFLTTFTANLSTALSNSCPAWSISPITGFLDIFIDVHVRGIRKHLNRM